MRWRRFFLSLWGGFLVGVGGGALQLLLWPRLPPSLGKACLATLAWGSWGALWLGLAGFVLWELKVFLAPGKGRPLGAQTLVLFRVVGLSLAALAFFNYQATAELLPTSHRQALQVVGGFAFLWGLLAWVTPRHLRQSWLVALLTLLWFPGVWWPWWGAREERPQQSPSLALEIPQKPRRALVVIWEGADIPWLLPLMDQGNMPFLQSLWPKGSWGQLRTLCPFSRAASLTSLATGCSPVLHGTLGRRAYRVRFITSEPVSLLLRGPWPAPHQLPWRLWQRAALPHPQEPFLWEVLAQWHVPAQVVGWPFPSQMAAAASAGLEAGELEPAWQVALEEALRPRPERSSASRRAFVLTAQAGLQAALKASGDSPQVLLLNVDLPLRLRPLWTGDDPGGVLPLAAQLLDGQLVELWRLFGGDNAYLLLASPYGMAPPTPADQLLASLGLGSRWRVSPRHCPDGFFFLLGPGVAAASRVRAARAQDLLPTLMYLLELPVARRLSGKVLLPAVDENFAGTVPLRLIPAYGGLGK